MTSSSSPSGVAKQATATATATPTTSRNKNKTKKAANIPETLNPSRSENEPAPPASASLEERGLGRESERRDEEDEEVEEEVEVEVEEQGKQEENEGETPPSSAETLPTHVQTFLDLAAMLQAAQKSLQQMKPLMKVLEKECKKLRNTSGRRKRGGGAPSASLQEPLVISPELNIVLGNEVGTRMKRPDITQAMSNYTKNNNLKDVDNKRVIVLNDDLARILKKPEGEPPARAGDRIDLFKLLGFLKHHITKPEDDDGDATSPPSAESNI